MGISKSSKKLNLDQVRAIEFGSGPLLIIAGAGTGKTTVITERIKYLITAGLAKPEEILALTFTEKAASEMEERVDIAMPLSYGDIWITTFHSFCDQILRDEALNIGLSSNFKLMTTAESLDLFKRNLFNFSVDYFRPLGNPNKFVGEILKHFSRLQDEVITPEAYLDWANNKLKADSDIERKKWIELASVYKEYNNLKIKEAKFDFGDLIIKTIELFEKRPNILKKYQNKFKYVLVDEFQDTNYAQNVLVDLIVNESKNITVVGDDNQSIYRFRGAAINNILKFRKTYKNAKTITLNENYRSTQEILDASYKLIKHNDPDTLEVRLGISKKLIAKSGLKNQKIEFIHTQNVNDESSEVAESINNIIKKEKYNYSDIAILVRANNHADPFIRELERRGIPNQFLGPSKLFEKEEVADLISYLKVLYDPEDSISFYRLLSSSIFEIKPLDLIKISSEARRKSIAIFEIVLESDNEILKKITSLINKHLNEIKVKTAGEMLFEFLNEFKIYEKIVKEEDDIKAKNISKFFEKIKEYENNNPTAKLQEIVDYLDLLSETGESPQVTDGDWQENNAVNILTVHSAKGLEFPVVYLVNLVSERFPSRARFEQISIPDDLIKEELPTGDFHLQEERRLFYVGMTRAKEYLFFSASEFYGDGKRKKKLSPFVMETLDDAGIGGEKRNKNNIEKSLKAKTIKVEIEQKSPNQEKIKLNYLSVSQIETFQTCPLHYALRYIYKIPTPPNPSISFGLSIHKTLKDFVGGEKDVDEIFLRNWIEEGYVNKKHKEEFFESGKRILDKFVKENKKFAAVALEENFKFRIDKTLLIGGVIDRIDKLSAGGFEIIDYKTGDKVPSQKEVDTNLQLSVYAMAVSEKYKVNPEDIKLSLYYLKDNIKMTTQRSEKDLEKVRKEILKVRDEIEQSNFKCNGNYFCQMGCEFGMFCKSGE